MKKLPKRAVSYQKIISFYFVMQFLSMRIASLSPVLYGFGMDRDVSFSDQLQVWGN